MPAEMYNRDEIYAYVGSRLRHFRKREGMKLQDIATIIDKSPQQYQKYETGVSKCPLDLIFELCRHYKVPADAILPFSVDSRTQDFRRDPLSADTEPKALDDIHVVDSQWSQSPQDSATADELARLFTAFSALSSAKQRNTVLALIESMIPGCSPAEIHPVAVEA